MEELLEELQEIKKLTLLGVKRALSMNDAALLTGLSKSHLYKLVCYKKIPYYKPDGGKLVFFDKDEISKWLLSNRIKPEEEVDNEAATYLTTGVQSRRETRDGQTASHTRLYSKSHLLPKKGKNSNV
ncbi:MAG: helix-turn-helix domain-containing protein [Bacteroidales bacterium]